MTGADPLAEARRAFHLDVTCPLCGAGFSQPCRSSSGKTRLKVHMDRTRVERDRPPASWVQDELFGPCEAP